MAQYIDKVQKIREKVERIQLYTQSEVLKQVLDYIDEVQKEPVSEDLEEAACQYANCFKNQFEMASMAFIKGANWQKEQDLIPSTELSNFIDKLSKQFPEVSFAKLSRIAVRVAKWQQEKEYTCYEEAFEDGAAWKAEQMMKDAIDAVVHIEAGGYPYIPQIELWDYDKDKSLAKEGDKYKVVLIKEN